MTGWNPSGSSIITGSPFFMTGFPLSSVSEPSPEVFQFFINNDNLIWTCKLKCRLDTIIDIVIFNFFNRCIENIDTFALQCRIREFIKPQYCIKCLTVK